MSDLHYVIIVPSDSKNVAVNLWGVESGEWRSALSLSTVCRMYEDRLKRSWYQFGSNSSQHWLIYFFYFV